MTLLVNVAGGTNAGRRIVRRPQQRFAWVHDCDAEFVRSASERRATVTVSLSPRYRRCPHCGAGRSS